MSIVILARRARDDLRFPVTWEELRDLRRGAVCSRLLTLGAVVRVWRQRK